MSEQIKFVSDQRPFEIVYWDFIESDLFDWNEKRIFIILKKYADSNNQCSSSIKNICRIAQLSKSTVIKTLKRLEEKKAIKIEHRIINVNGKHQNQSNVYTLYDYQEIWDSENIDGINNIDFEELQLFELAKKKGYRLEKEPGTTMQFFHP